MADNKVPDIVVSRLPLYLRGLTLMADEGREVVSSQELGKWLGISSAQIRKDLSNFGEFGKQGTGYEISYLIQQLKQILHLEHVWPVVLIGCGALGHALAHYNGFKPKGFEIVAIFDNDPNKVGQKAGNKTILDVDDLPGLVRERGIKVAILATPSSTAQEMVDMLVKSGIDAILNYAPISVLAPPDVQVQYIDPSVHLQRMTFYLE